ncbi:MAG: glycosyltransferase [Deferribacteres bacterium]|nr:glycosyltransferase [Deferribacteres bacterium]
MNSNALIIIAKYPEKGKVKTRLKGLISDNKRVELYVNLLNQTMHKLGKIPGIDTFIAFAPESAGEYFSRFNVRLIPMQEGDLGAGMFHAFREVFNAGYEKAALVGADIPDISPSIILSAFDALSGSDLVYGPAKDGGYYLVGMRKLIREVFRDVPWSSEKTLRKSLYQAGRYGYSVALIEILNDIDTIDDAVRAGLLNGYENRS